MDDEKKLYLLLISVHGLIRGENLELGRDSDTGGQTKYVVELARALGQHPSIARVDLVTQRVEDPAIDPIYSQSLEKLSDNVQIVRIDCGEPEYVPKEQLWEGLDSFSDNIIDYINKQQQKPDLIHSHYADAGYVATRFSHVLNIPLVHTGHSLGRVKRRRLLASGLKKDDIEQRFNISRRIDAEEDVLALADRIIASTHQEIDEQYGMYDCCQSQKMCVIPPGTDLERFHPVQGNERESHICRVLGRFLQEPEKPMILALSRPDQRKNIGTLIEAYGESEALRSRANLVVVAGNRDDIHEMEDSVQQVLTDILLLIDRYDLYGCVAYPKHHESDDVSILYRLAVMSKGVFVNPALTEPFGLTLIEAAACGLPLVATEDGGPTDIIQNCKNGELIDPLDKQAMADVILGILDDPQRWQNYSDNGLVNVEKYYSWQAHVDQYIQQVTPLFEGYQKQQPVDLMRRPMLFHDRALFTDLDQNLLAVPNAISGFVDTVRRNRTCLSFGIATGRRLDSALKELRKYGIPQPDVLITSLGTEIYYAPNLTRDTAWNDHIDHLWKPMAVRKLLEDIPGLKLQPKIEQSRFKISYYIDPKKAPSLEDITSLLHRNDLVVNAFLSFGQYLDIVPIRASKGFAMRWFANQWGIDFDHILVAGGSGADEDMMRGNTLAVVVANRHDEELTELTDLDSVYFARQPGASGILEAIKHYGFIEQCKVRKS